jgi:hypothetical protein
MLLVVRISKICSFQSSSMSSAKKSAYRFFMQTIRGNKNRSQLSEFCSEAFCGRKHALNSVRKLSFLFTFSKTRQLKNSKIVSEKRRLLRYRQIIFVSYFGCFVKLIFSHNYIPFRALELTLPRTSECVLLPRNNGNRSKSILRNFFSTNFCSRSYPEYWDQVITLAFDHTIILFRFSNYFTSCL